MSALDALCDGWREALRRRYRKRAARAGANHRPVLAAWYASRARALERRFLDRASDCCDVWIATLTMMCLGCGVVSEKPVKCGLRAWCDTCATSYRTVVRDRMQRGLEAALASEMRRWRMRGCMPGQMPVITLVTLTVRHSGSLAADRHTITRGWQRLRSWLWHVDDGRALPYVLAWELTPGSDGLGHVHAHVAAVWPFRDLRALDAEWQRATGGHGLTVDVKGGGTRTRKAGAVAAARYVSTYINKGGADDSTPLPMRAEWLRLARTHRAYTASRGLLPERAPAPCVEPGCAGKCTSVGYSRHDHSRPRAGGVGTAEGRGSGAAAPLGRADYDGGPFLDAAGGRFDARAGPGVSRCAW